MIPFFCQLTDIIPVDAKGGHEAADRLVQVPTYDMAVGEDDPCIGLRSVPGDESGEGGDGLLVVAGPGEDKALRVQDPSAPGRSPPGVLKALYEDQQLG